MALIFLVLYVMFVVLLFAGAIHWARKKKQQLKNPTARRKMSATSILLVKDLPREWYVSLQFCIGFALSAFLVVVIYKIFLQYWK